MELPQKSQHQQLDERPLHRKSKLLMLFPSTVVGTTDCNDENPSTVVHIQYSMIELHSMNDISTSRHTLTCEIDDTIVFSESMTAENIWTSMLKEKKTNSTCLKRMEQTGVKVLGDRRKHFVAFNHLEKVSKQELNLEIKNDI